MYPDAELHVPFPMCNAYSMTNAQPSAAKLQWTRGDRLGKSLRYADVSNAEMAEILGVSRNTVGNYIADRTPITDGYLRLWAMRTGVTYDELKYGLSETPEPEPGESVTRWYRTKKPHKLGAIAEIGSRVPPTVGSAAAAA